MPPGGNYLVYKYVDPFLPGEHVFYVGQTKNMKRRDSGSVRLKGANGYFMRYYLGLRANRYEPEPMVIEDGLTESDTKAMEKQYIEAYLLAGHPITNSTHTPDVFKKMPGGLQKAQEAHRKKLWERIEFLRTSPYLGR